MKILYKTLAIRHLRSILTYIAQDDPTAAAQVVDGIEKAIEGLRDFPHSHRAGAKRGSRELVVPRLPYLVVYQVFSQHVTILGVFHAARHPSLRSRP